MAGAGRQVDEGRAAEAALGPVILEPPDGLLSHLQLVLVILLQGFIKDLLPFFPSLR